MHSLFSLIIILFSQALHATGPQAGEYFYRADTRHPNEIFGVNKYIKIKLKINKVFELN